MLFKSFHLAEKTFKKFHCLHIGGTTEDGVPFMWNLGFTTQYQLDHKKLYQALAQSKRNYRTKDGQWIKDGNIFTEPQFHKTIYDSNVSKAYIVHFFKGIPKMLQMKKNH